MRILIVDDHAVTREGLRQFIDRHEAHPEVLEAATCAEALERATADAPSLALLDLGLPDATGLDALRRLREAAPQLPVVVFSASDDADSVREALALGARGFISKSADAAMFQQALTNVLDGIVHVPASAIAAEARAVTDASPAAFADQMRSTILALTPRQREVLDLLVDGLTNKHIGKALGISPETAKIHVSGVLKALRAPNRARAVVAAAAAGMRFPQGGASRA